MKIDNLKLRTKVLIPLGLMVAVVVAMVVFGATRLIGVSATASDIIEKRDLAAVELTRAAAAMSGVPHAVFAVLLYDQDDKARKAAKADFEAMVPEAGKLLDSAALHLPDKAAEIGKFKERFDKLAEAAKEPMQISLETPGLIHGIAIQQIDLVQMGHGASLATDVDSQVRALIGDMNAFNQALLDANAAASQGLNVQASLAVWNMAAVGVASILIAGAFALWMSTFKITRPLVRMVERMRALAQGDLQVEIDGLDRGDEVGEMANAVQVFKNNAVERLRVEKEAAEHRSEADSDRRKVESEKTRAAETQTLAMSQLGDGLRRLAGGDLTARLDHGFPDAFAKIRDDFNAAASKLMETVRAVVASTSAIHAGSHEISTSSDDLSRRTEQQAARLEEAAAALDEITATLKKSAEGAKQAAVEVASADDNAKQGAVVVKQAVEAMDAIAKSSEQIGQIIGVIDEIAFQTNLLALNAGVEAARAGDAGRGFAVVASEVRALAQRSAEAAKEIKSLISTSSSQVDSGVQLVAESGKALDRIIAQVSKINGIVSEIATSAEQQATGLQQVNAAISQMDETTQKNATMVEESNAASHSLSQETSQLANLVEQFQVEGRDGGALRRELRKVAPHAFAKPCGGRAGQTRAGRDRRGPRRARQACAGRAAAAAAQGGGRRPRRGGRRGKESGPNSDAAASATRGEQGWSELERGLQLRVAFAAAALPAPCYKGGASRDSRRRRASIRGAFGDVADQHDRLCPRRRRAGAVALDGRDQVRQLQGARPQAAPAAGFRPHRGRGARAARPRRWRAAPVSRRFRPRARARRRRRGSTRRRSTRSSSPRAPLRPRPAWRRRPWTACWRCAAWSRSSRRLTTRRASPTVCAGALQSLDEAIAALVVARRAEGAALRGDPRRAARRDRQR